MAAKRLLITYYTAAGNTKKMADAIRKGAEKLGVTVVMKDVEQCSVGDLAEADGVVVGSPTYFSNVAWQVKKLIDESIALYRRERELSGKVGGCFTSSGTHRDGKDCIRMMELAFGFHHKMKMIPGIIRSSGDPEEAVSKMCEAYGTEVARQIISETTSPPTMGP